MVEGSPIITHSRYLQLFLDPGIYVVRLQHVDIFAFTDEYTLTVNRNAVYVKIFRRPGSNKLEFADKLPVDFTEKFTPVTS